MHAAQTVTAAHSLIFATIISLQGLDRLPGIFQLLCTYVVSYLIVQ